MAVRMVQRRGSSTQWSTANPVLTAGEIGYETNTGKFKIGDSTNHWNDLPYFINDDSLSTSLGDYVLVEELGVANGVATLDANGLIPAEQLPPISITDVHVVADQAARLALTAEPGDVAIQEDTGDSYMLAASPASTNANWKKLTSASEIQAAIDALDSDDIEEGATNEYFTDARAKTSAADLLTNAILTNIQITGNGSGLTITAENGVDDSDTDDLDEGSVNKYFTDERAKIAAADLITNATQTNITITGDENGLTFTAPQSVADSTTDDLDEGTTNKYFTTQRARDSFTGGTGLDYSSVTGQFDIDSTVTTNSGNQTLTNKTINLSSNTISGTTAQFNTALSDDDFATLTNTVTLTNKSIDLANNTVTGTISEFNSALSDANFATQAGIETLTNKTISYADNTITVHVSNVSDLTATASEINTLDGITVSTSELNILDGATLTTTELNYVDGVTSAIQDQLDDKAPLASPTFTGTTTVDDIEIGGSLTFTGTGTQINYNEIVVEDPIIYLGEGNTANINDLGFVANYNDGTYQHTGLVRDSSAGKWKLFTGVTDEPTNTVNFAQGSLDTLAVGSLELTTALGPIYGGTGLTSYATGDIVYASASNTLSKLSAGTNGYLLTMSSGVPVWAAAPVSLPSQTGNEGKYLTTDGSTASWATVASGGGADEIKILMGAL